jgi:hypothetical protein
MNKRQKDILINIITVLVITAIAVLVMINFKDWVNRSEAMRAMEQLGYEALRYRKANGSLPPESYIDSIKGKMQGSARLGKVHYRALWIDHKSTPDTILAYTEKNYRSLLFHPGFIIIRLDGTIQWMERQTFLSLLEKQQSPMEKEMLLK